MDEEKQVQKEKLRQQALRQLRLEALICRNMELSQELETLRSNNPNRRKYTLMAGLATIFLYSLVLILAVSLLVSGDLSQMFGFFLGWTILFATALILLCFPIRKLRKLDKELEVKAGILQEERLRNNQEIAVLQIIQAFARQKFNLHICIHSSITRWILTLSGSRASRYPATI